ncbi:MAG TPA: hypothetical protein VM144_08030 [Aestuariivirga sp.]|nr:hypothetical protein [Aestuariivirga sp.]
MLSRILSAAAFALIASTLLMPTAADAGSRWRFLNPGYYFYDPPPRDFYADDYDDEEYYENDERPLAYYDPDDDFYEPRYQGEEPVYIAPKKKQKKTAKAVPAAKPAVKKSVASTEKKTVTSSVASVEKKAVTPVEPVEKKTASAASGMSCDKAGKIVSGYGFASVKPTTCTGQVFAFNATRSGKAYVIKLSSASGELTEVKKVQ